MKGRQRTGSRLGRSRPFRVFFIAVIAVAAMMVFAPAASAATINVPADQPTIQDAINAAASGDTINVAAGSYSEYLSINKEVSIIGAGSAQVTINYGGLAGSNNAGVYVSANNVTIQGMTIDGNSLATPRYGLKVGAVSGVTISDVIVQNAYRSGFDLLGTSSSSLDNVQTLNNGGHGIALTDCNAINLSNVTASGNAWSSIGVATWGRYTPLGTSGIVFSGTNSFGGIFQLEEGDYNNPGVPPAGDAIITYSTNIADAADVTVQAGELAYAVHGAQDDAPDQERTVLLQTLADAQAMLAACSSGCGHFTGLEMYIESLTDPTQLYVSLGGSIQAAIAAASAGDTINIAAGTYVEGPQFHIDKDLSIVGDDRATTILQPASDTGSSGDSRGWFLVDDGVTFNLSEVTLDGTGRNVHQAIRTRGSGTVGNVDFIEIKHPGYSGVGAAVFGSGNVDFTGCTFSEIGRIGVLYYGTGITGSTFSGNTYTGKGPGDWLDYALDISAGAVVDVTDNVITGNRGVASSDGSTSAGVLVTTYFGGGTTAYIEGNVIGGNTSGIAVGYDAADASTTTIIDNDMSGNDSNGVTQTGTTRADASGNWWGSGEAATVATLVNGDVDYSPWLASGADTDVGTPGFQGDFSTLWVDDDSAQAGATGHIEEAIDLVTASTIYLAPGTYAGADVDKSVSIIGQAGVLVNSGPLYGGGGRFECDGIHEMDYGFQVLAGGSGSTISNIRFEDVSFPVYGRSADDVIISGNTLINPLQGISNRSGSRWSVTGNTITDLRSSNGGGIGIIMLEGSGGAIDDNIIDDNTISGTLHVPACESGGYEGTGIVVYADWRWYPYFTGATSVSGNQVTDNTIDLASDTPAVLGVSGIELTNAKDDADPALPEVPSIVTGNTISGNTIGGDLAYGLNVIGATGNTISGNSVSDADTGLSVESSNDGEDGLSCSKNNTVTGNVFIDNAVQAVLGDPVCNSGNGFDGNYWSDYTGPGPYVFSTGQDNSPSGPPQVTYVAPTGVVNVSDPEITATVVGGTPTGMFAEVGLAAILDPSQPWDVDTWVFECTIVGGDISCPASGLPEGDFIATVTVIDENGSMDTDTGEFTIEDDAPPVTTDDAPAGWVNTDVTVALTCTDAVTGCAETTYEVDGGPTQTGNTVVLTDEGVHTITYRSSDNDTPPHVESDNTATVRIDKTAPTTTDDADSDWHNSDVTVNLSCDDGVLSGCDTTYWSTDQGESGTGNALVTVEGDNTLTYYSTDVAGNTEAANTVHVYIDKTAPVVTYTGPTGTVYTLVTNITGTVTDAALSSGIDPATGAVMSLDNGATFPYSCTVSGSDIDCAVSGLANDTYDVVIQVTDNAGNTGTANGSFTYAANGKPHLSLSVKRVYWASMEDYTYRELSVDYLINNNSVGITAEGVEVVGTDNTNSVLLASATPVTVGDIAVGTSGAFTLKYLLPMGVSQFQTRIYATAYDPAGTFYEYPGPYSTP